MIISMMSWLTEPELDAAYQLIQLSGDSAADADSSRRHSSSSSSKSSNTSFYRLLRRDIIEAESIGVNTNCSPAAARDHEILFFSSSSSSSASSSSSSSSAISIEERFDVCEEIDAASLRKRKFRSIADLYAHTKPNLVKKAVIRRTSS